jgi:AraC-like DNA-binding protein
MSSRSFPHQLIPPPDPFPTWQGTSAGPLVYLAWGKRDYHRFPIPVHSNPGWTYWILLQGEAVVETPGARRTFSAGSGFHSGPDCAFGFPPQPPSETRVVVWIWKEAPGCLEDPDPSVLHPASFREEQVRLLEDLHAQTRMEIFQSRPHSQAALTHLQGLMEIQFARAAGTEASGTEEILLQRAREWMFEHLSQQASMQDLAHYLGISVMRLHRLFQAKTGTSPGAFYHDLKMKHCGRLLKRPGYSVKRVAYENGYRHANDFSRAFKNHFKVAPSFYAESNIHFTTEGSEQARRARSPHNGG